MQNSNKTEYSLYTSSKKRIILTLSRSNLTDKIEDSLQCLRLVLVINGCGEVTSDKLKNSFSQGDVFIFSDEKSFELTPFGDAEIYLFKFNLSDFIDGDYKILTKELLEKFRLQSKDGFEKLNGIHASAKKILNSAFMIENEFENKTDCSEYVIKAYIALIISLVIQYFSKELDNRELRLGNHYSDVEKSLVYINENLSEKLTLDDLAKIANMGKTGYSAAFKNITGMTVWEYILNARIELASRYLIEKGDEFNVTEIAMMCGFNNTTHFINIFKKIRGSTPRDFKKNYDNPCF